MKISIENEWSVISKRVEKIVEGMNVQARAHISMSSSQSLFKQGSVTESVTSESNCNKMKSCAYGVCIF